MIKKFKGGENIKNIYLILILSIVFILSLNFAFASDNINNTALSIDDDSSTVLENSQQDFLNTGEGSFADLKNDIDAASGEVTLNKSYIYTSGVDSGGDGIKISKPITIDGNGNTIDANHLSRVFNIKSNDVVIKNVTFINGNASGVGGAIYAGGYMHNLSLIDCKFINNTASPTKNDEDNTISQGGAIYLYVYNNVTIVNCSFYNNTASQYGGAITYIGSSYNSIDNCDFNGNTAPDGGAIAYWALNIVDRSDLSAESNNNSINNCNFNGNTAQSTPHELFGDIIYDDGKGGAIFSSDTSWYNKIDNCNFNGNDGALGGAIFWDMAHSGGVANCNFTDNTALEYGGAILWSVSENGSIDNCNFNNNTANENGGAIYWWASYDGTVDNYPQSPIFII